MVDFDTERFIQEMKVRPGLWDFESPQYTDKRLRIEMWEDICAVFYPNVTQTSEREDICKNLRKRWRSLRDCFAREVHAQKLKSANSSRKQYVFYNQLLFLLKGVGKRKKKPRSKPDKSTSTSQTQETICGEEVDDSEVTEIKDESSAVEEVSPPEIEPAPTAVETVNVQIPRGALRRRPYERVAGSKRRLLQDVKRLTGRSTVGTSTHTEGLEEEDEDRLFLMSLLKDVKKVHEDNKLELKSEMMLLLKKWQRAQVTHSYPQSSSNSNH